MTEKYIDLAEKITGGSDQSNTVSFRMGVAWALEYLDTHPEQVPGRAMKKSDYQELMDGTSLSYGVGFTDGFHMAGGSVVLDPEPTNADKLLLALDDAVADGELIEWALIAERLDAAGVKAPGGDDD